MKGEYTRGSPRRDKSFHKKSTFGRLILNCLFFSGFRSRFDENKFKTCHCFINKSGNGLIYISCQPITIHGYRLVVILNK